MFASYPFCVFEFLVVLLVLRTRSIIVIKDDLMDRYPVSLKILNIQGGKWNISYVKLIPVVGKKYYYWQVQYYILLTGFAIIGKDINWKIVKSWDPVPTGVRGLIITQHPQAKIITW